jgi:uncharacterized lipoprotein YddW (UPF0748 family)
LEQNRGDRQAMSLKKRSRQFFRGWIGRSLLVTIGLWVVLSIWQAPVVQQGKSQTQELRGVWMTNYGSTLMYYTTRLDEAIADLATHHLNTLYPSVWNQGYTLHPSPVARKAGGSDRSPLLHLPLLPYQDVLSGLVTQAHRQHLRLIPWFEYGLMISTNSPIAQQHPDWLTLTQEGDKTLAPTVQIDSPLSEDLQEFSDKNQSWLNPAHPAVQQFLTDLIVDVVKRYPVDGIQLDDHFSLPIKFGYDPYTVNLYRKEHNSTAPPQNPADPDWMEWRAAKITQLMGKISKAVKATRKGAIVSLSPNAPDFAYATSLQDWPNWTKQGLVDEVVVQVYRKEIADLQAVLNSPRLLSLNSQSLLSIGLYTGPMLNAKPIQQLQQEAEAVQNSKYKGVSFFCWETTFWLFKKGSNNQVHQMFQKLFP